MNDNDKTLEERKTEIQVKLLSTIHSWMVLIPVMLLLWFLLSLWTDDTDESFWNRSGVHHIIDYGTGCEYLSRNGNLFPRFDKNNRHICGRVK